MIGRLSPSGLDKGFGSDSGDADTPPPCSTSKAGFHSAALRQEVDD
jgi:hypothetical protein